MKEISFSHHHGYFHHADHSHSTDYAHCLQCGSVMEPKLLPGELRHRLVCSQCGFVFYQNPKVVVATVLEQSGQLILVRRGIEPRKGTWSYPGGFLELGESLEEGALRETKEETNLDARITSLLNVYSRPAAGVVVIVYSARVVGGEATICEETSEVGCFWPSTIPWDDLSFPTTEWALRDWLTRNGM